MAPVLSYPYGQVKTLTGQVFGELQPAGQICPPPAFAQLTS